MMDNMRSLCIQDNPINEVRLKSTALSQGLVVALM